MADYRTRILSVRPRIAQKRLQIVQQRPLVLAEPRVLFVHQSNIDLHDTLTVAKGGEACLDVFWEIVALFAQPLFDEVGLYMVTVYDLSLSTHSSNNLSLGSGALSGRGINYLLWVY